MKKENAVCGCCGYLHFSAVGLSVARYCNIAVIATALVSTASKLVGLIVIVAQLLGNQREEHLHLVH